MQTYKIEGISPARIPSPAVTPEKISGLTGGATPATSTSRDAVTPGEARQYLTRLRTERRQLADIRQSLQSAEELAHSVRAVRYDRDRVQTSPVNALEEIVIRLELMKIRHIETMATYSQHAMTTLHLLEEMANPAEAITLRLYYVDGIPYTQLEQRHPLQYSQRHIARLMTSGLESFAEIMTKHHIKNI